LFARRYAQARWIGAASFLILASALCLAGLAHATPPADGPSLRQVLAAPDEAKPDFTLPDLSGSPLALREHAARIVLVHFFATWCEPCRDELASLAGVAGGPLSRRVSVIAVDVAEPPVRVRRFFASAPVPFPVVLDADRAVSRAWGVGILPTTFVLDAGLRPRLFVEGDVDWSRPDIQSALQAIDAVRFHLNPQPQ
jgi:peroxiredoxin